MKYKVKVIERVCKVYAVEADDKADAERKHEEGDSELIEQFPLNGEQFVEASLPE
jgi:hypothetical protein